MQLIDEIASGRLQRRANKGRSLCYIPGVRITKDETHQTSTKHHL